MPANRAVIVGIGKSSSQFTEKLVSELVSSQKGHGLVAVGIHDNGPAGPKIRQTIHRLTRKNKLDVDDISVNPSPTLKSAEPELSDLVTLQRRVVGHEPRLLLVIIDAAYMKQEKVSKLFFSDLKTVAKQANIVAICFTDDDIEEGERRAYDFLEAHTWPDRRNNQLPVLEAAFIVRTNSPLEVAVGSEDAQDSLLAKSLAGIWSAPLVRRQNPDFERQIKLVRLQEKRFIGLAVRSDGLSMKKPNSLVGRLLYPILRHTTRGISKEEAAECLTDMVYALLESQPKAMSTMTPYAYLGPEKQSGDDIHEVPISVNLIMPFRSSDRRFEEVSAIVQKALTSARTRTVDAPFAGQPAGSAHATTGGAQPTLAYTSQGFGGQLGASQLTTLTERGYTVKAFSSVWGRGVKHLGSRPGKFYFQVCVLFAVDKPQVEDATGA